MISRKHSKDIMRLLLVKSQVNFSPVNAMAKRCLNLLISTLSKKKNLNNNKEERNQFNSRGHKFNLNLKLNLNNNPNSQRLSKTFSISLDQAVSQLQPNLSHQ